MGKYREWLEEGNQGAPVGTSSAGADASTYFGCCGPLSSRVSQFVFRLETII